ncbi:MAG TPA: XrtA/PEP-CTERM system histidine kinase PrsK [Bradyrhizobium sp.]|nr:XrtA/PEP-CTERM system histidine kinase PrsK [Bradyrhizobium sp.]
MIVPGNIGYIAAFAGYVGLALVYAVWGRWGRQGYAFLLATLLTAAWAGVSAIDLWPMGMPYLADLLQHAASLAWILFLWMLIAFGEELRKNYPRRVRTGWALIGAMSALVIGADLLQLFGLQLPSTPPIALGLLISVTGLFLTETVFRSFRSGDRWGVKYICLGVGGRFAYDVVFFADALLYRTIDETLSEVRGFALLLLVPFFVVNIVRSESRHLALGLSSQMVFGSAVVFGTGIYLGLMTIAAYYIRDFGGSWSQALQVLFVFGVILLLCVALLSGSFRSYLRRFLAEHIQKQKFDYRQEWRRLVQRISLSDSEEPLDLRVVKSLADLLDSPAGALWLLEGETLSLAASWNVSLPSLTSGDAAMLVDLFRDRELPIDLRRRPEGGNVPATPLLPAPLQELARTRFLLPLFHHDNLMGIVLLTDPRAPRTLDLEDIELVTMASRQAAGYLSEQRSARKLAEAREFEKFNRRYAFVTHDIKNLVSQLSLVVRNFEKFGDRPDFRQDMLATVRSAVQRLNHLMERLKADAEPDHTERVTVKPLIEKAIEERTLGEANISLECAADVAALAVRADSRRVDAILRHLLQNALEASGSGGKIVIGLRRERNSAVIEVRDSGDGMEPEFIRTELFRPFRSTKPGGMGIGAYQCRTYARELGGDLEAISSVGAGTTMRVTLPLLRDA